MQMPMEKPPRIGEVICRENLENWTYRSLRCAVRRSWIGATAGLCLPLKWRFASKLHHQGWTVASSSF